MANNKIELLTDTLGIVRGVTINGEELHNVHLVRMEHTPQGLPEVTIKLHCDPDEIEYKRPDEWPKA